MKSLLIRLAAGKFECFGKYGLNNLSSIIGGLVPVMDSCLQNGPRQTWRSGMLYDACAPNV